MSARELDAALRLLTPDKGDRRTVDVRFDAWASGHGAREETAARGRVKELVWGALRLQGALDHLLDQQLRKPSGIDPRTRAILRIGAYRLLILHGVPAHAAVDGAVELARRSGRQRMKGLVNGVLRGLERRRATDDGEGAPDPRRDLPLPGARVRFRDAAFPDPAGDPAGALAARYSHPRWLVARWLARADAAVVERRLAANNARPPLTLRARPGGRDALLARLSDAGVAARPAAHPQSIDVDGGAPSRLPGWDEGAFVVQDASATAAVELALAHARPGQRVLELAAAPGGKTTQLLDRVEGLRVLAVDRSRARLRRLTDSCARLGLGGALPLAADGAALPLSDGADFDGAMADVPCSNTGVIGRRVDLRWRLREGDLESLVELQSRMLEQAARRVRPGGWLLYSTCSIEAEENRDQVVRLCAREPGWSIVEERAYLPEECAPASGGYAALLVRERRVV